METPAMFIFLESTEHLLRHVPLSLFRKSAVPCTATAGLS